MTPEEVQKLLDEQRAQILAEVDRKIEAAFKAERERIVKAFDEMKAEREKAKPA